MKEIVIISGKGGTGKTSITACFAALCSNAVFADCDVDAADLHLVLDPKIRHQEPFISGKKVTINEDQCTACGRCEELCVFDAIIKTQNGDKQQYRIDPIACEGCCVCARFCPARAIETEAAHCGDWFISDTAFGSLVHAKLHIAEENSGKLVTLVRSKAREIAEAEKRDLILVDGPPGTGCPVIASIGGVDLALIITEPTLSGLHDLERACELTQHFNVETAVCVNKYDINPTITGRIEETAAKLKIPVAGRIPYHDIVTKAQLEGKSVIQYNGENPAARQIRLLWEDLEKRVQ